MVYEHWACHERKKVLFAYNISMSRHIFGSKMWVILASAHVLTYHDQYHATLSVTKHEPCYVSTVHTLIRGKVRNWQRSLRSYPEWLKSRSRYEISNPCTCRARDPGWALIERSRSAISWSQFSVSLSVSTSFIEAVPTACNIFVDCSRVIGK